MSDFLTLVIDFLLNLNIFTLIHLSVKLTNTLTRIWNCLPHMDANLSAASVLTLIKSYINFNSVYCSVLSSVSLYFLFIFWLVLLPWPVLQCFSLTCFVLPNLFLFSLTCVSLLSLCFLFCYCHDKVEINKYNGLSCDSSYFIY